MYPTHYQSCLTECDSMRKDNCLEKNTHNDMSTEDYKLEDEKGDGLKIYKKWTGLTINDGYMNYRKQTPVT